MQDGGEEEEVGEKEEEEGGTEERVERSLRFDEGSRKDRSKQERGKERRWENKRRNEPGRIAGEGRKRISSNWVEREKDEGRRRVKGESPTIETAGRWDGENEDRRTFRMKRKEKGEKDRGGIKDRNGSERKEE